MRKHDTFLCTDFLIYKKQIDGLQFDFFQMFKLYQAQMFQESPFLAASTRLNILTMKLSN